MMQAALTPMGLALHPPLDRWQLAAVSGGGPPHADRQALADRLNADAARLGTGPWVGRGPGQVRAPQDS